MGLLQGFRAVQLGPGPAAAACGRIVEDVGAAVARIGVDRSSLLSACLNRGRDADESALADANLIVAEGSPATLRRAGHDAAALHRRNPTAAIVLISWYIGQSGPRAEDPASDLTGGVRRRYRPHADRPGRRPVGAADPPGRAAIRLHRRPRCRLRRHARCPGPLAVGDRRLDPGGAGHARHHRTDPRRTDRKVVAPPAHRGRQWRYRVHLAGRGWVRRHFAARREALGRLAGGHGQPRLEPGAALRPQAGPRRQLGRPARADVRVEPRQDQAVDRRRGPGGARPQLPATRAGRAAVHAATPASRLLPN